MHAIHLLEQLPWPLDTGRAINAHHLMRGLVERGHRVTALLRNEPNRARLDAWPLRDAVAVEVLRSQSVGTASSALTHSATARRWRRYWGVDEGLPAATAAACARLEPDYVEGCGLAAPLWMTDLPTRTPKLWFVGDDAGLLHWSLASTATSIRGAVTERLTAVRLWMYERAVATWVDAAVAVSPADAATLRRLGGAGEVLVTPNGVDTDYFSPGSGSENHRTAVFCGRLDFPPNIDAVRWFLRAAWPSVLSRCPQARFLVVGRAPVDAVRDAVKAASRVDLLADVADVRPWVRGASVVVLPMRAGAGIKNKLLEAAAMAKAIIASPRAVAGLVRDNAEPWVTCDSPSSWASATGDLLSDAAAAERLGRDARRWVEANHRWSAHAEAREAWLAQSCGDGAAAPLQAQILPPMRGVAA